MKIEKKERVAQDFTTVLYSCINPKLRSLITHQIDVIPNESFRLTFIYLFIDI